MNYIVHLNTFFQRIRTDDRITPAHISMYLSLFQAWNINRFQNPVLISRNAMMKASKIRAKATYHKVIKELHDFEYIVYKPSYNPFTGSTVYLTAKESGHQSNGQTGSDRILSETESATTHGEDSNGSPEEQVPVQETSLITNNTNIVNYKHSKQHTHESASSDVDQANSAAKGSSDEGSHHENSAPGGAPAEASAKMEGPPFPGNKRKQEPLSPPTNNNQRPTISDQRRTNALPESLKEVRAFFEEQKSTPIEGEKFFNHFQSNGWKVGGRAPMKDWHAAARNWILNSSRFDSKPRPSQLQATTGKNYAEPL
jgi:hypothetical protein